ncbi:adaptin ear-binding coat-associated protein 1 NECAP-1 [Dissoconium aciculare CBS 342.82]|uniref:Adaptin ear-binding coat-associated protein 1 NECAP-1 n=1 Tax=Dissoconium aciculare CBS 342.82 TaxID=1314786 RepID=A0A6J3M469_9PEZI|nr:adaptin ear-binding coat-associated protein 1 NECAP-1 [Dissoconium aciculare CBS 342.82]KAF1821712.1 adaptin ear-binding coat-associated protein 1 NECAP-1 [Dissoconium aciculare CBS 342.82]
MTTTDPATGQPLPDSAIQRVLFATTGVHVYQIPPLTSNRGFTASQWTSPTQPTAQQIFTSRLRIIETSLGTKIKADIVLEDTNTGDLFAAAPYTASAVVQQANDSSRFFAVRVQGEGGMKATLGIGFEDRSPAFDFGIALGEVRKVLGIDNVPNNQDPARKDGSSAGKIEAQPKQDFSLKDGEKIHIQVGSKGRRGVPTKASSGAGDDAALFSIAPPPPPASEIDSTSTSLPKPTQDGKSAAELGFDDGEFGEFQ